MQAVQSVCDRLGHYISAYKPELLCAIPLALLVLFGCFSAPWWAYAVILSALAMSILLCNPFSVWDRLLPPKARILLAAGILIALLPVSFRNVDPMAKFILWGLSAGLWAVALWRRKLWLELWQIKQSADVDTVLAHLSHDGDWQAGKAWEQYGCRETRALLHQTLWSECNESEMQRTYMPVYLLGFLHGKAADASQRKRVESERAALDRQAHEIEQQEAEIAKLRRSNDLFKEQLAQEQERYYTVGRYAKELEQRLNNMTLPQNERDAAILACVQAGYSLQDAGSKYGLSKSGAAAAVKRAKQFVQTNK